MLGLCQCSMLRRNSKYLNMKSPHTLVTVDQCSALLGGGFLNEPGLTVFLWQKHGWQWRAADLRPESLADCSQCDVSLSEESN